MDKMVQLYNWSDPEEKIHTLSGVVPVSIWLQWEKGRIGSERGRLAEIRYKKGQIALFVNDMCGL